MMDSAKHQQFAERVVRNQHRVFRYIVSLVAQQADAEELFQETCLTLWENWERYDLTLDFVPWACGIAHNKVRNFYRKRQHSQVQLDDDVVELLAARSLERQQHEDNRLTALRLCLNELPERSRSIIESYYGGQTVQELADQRSATRNAIYKLLDRVRETLHDCVSLRIAGEASP